MKITTKGQVTIPRAIREKHGLWPDTEIDFVERGGRVFIQKRNGTGSRGQKLVAKLRGRAEIKMSTDEIMGLTRGG